MAEAVDILPARHSRFWLFAPFVLLGLAAAGWSVAWFVIRQRTADGLDAWLASEAGMGRQWTCADRAVGGYPFRIEVSCGTLSVRRGEAVASLGRLLAIAQVYRPRHVIAEVGGPLRASDGEGAVAEADWRLLQVSVQSASDAFQRASLVVEEPKVRLAGLAPTELAGGAGHLEAHVRPDPARLGAEGAYDVALSARTMTIPVLNAWTGSDDPADMSLDTTVTQARGLTGRRLVGGLERWREAGGAIEVEQWTLAQGARRLEAKGVLRLDDLPGRPVISISPPPDFRIWLERSWAGDARMASARCWARSPASPRAPVRWDHRKARRLHSPSCPRFRPCAWTMDASPSARSPSLAFVLRRFTEACAGSEQRADPAKARSRGG